MHIVHIITGLHNGGESVLHRLTTNDKYHRHTVFSLTSGGKYLPLFSSSAHEFLPLTLKVHDSL